MPALGLLPNYRKAISVLDKISAELSNIKHFAVRSGGHSRPANPVWPTAAPATVPVRSATCWCSVCAGSTSATAGTVHDVTASPATSSVCAGCAAAAAPVRHGPTTCNSAVHDGPTAGYSTVHHCSAASSSAVLDGPTTRDSTVCHGPAAIDSAVRHVVPSSRNTAVLVCLFANAKCTVLSRTAV